MIIDIITEQVYSRSQLDNWGKWASYSPGGIVSHNETLANGTLVVVFDHDDAEIIEEYMLDLGVFCPKARKALEHIYLYDRTVHMGSDQMNISRNTFRALQSRGEGYMGARLKWKYDRLFGIRKT